MFVAKVTGAVVATQKVDTMVGQKLLVVEPFRLEPNNRSELITTGRTFIAVDTLGAGVGDMVLITQGSSARFTPETNKLPSTVSSLASSTPYTSKRIAFTNDNNYANYRVTDPLRG